MTEPIKVLFIAGAGRSGSTLLDRLIGQLDGFFSCGELQFIWKAGYGANQLCSCHTPLRDCSFWGEALKEAFPDEDLDALIETGAALTDQVGRRKSLPALMVQALQTPGFKRALARYREMTLALYRAAAARAEGAMLIDSSLDPTHALILMGIPEIELHTLHLVRDPRAVAYSRTKPKVRTELGEDAKPMPRTAPPVTAVKWTGVNALSEHLLGRTRYQRIGYEELVRAPEDALARILDHVGIEADIAQAVTGDQAHLRTTHTALGNPNKFKTGDVTLAEDARWKDGLPKLQTGLVKALCGPLMTRYRYV
jgi:hypothetical protein